MWVKKKNIESKKVGEWELTKKKKNFLIEEISKKKNEKLNLGINRENLDFKSMKYNLKL